MTIRYISASLFIFGLLVLGCQKKDSKLTLKVIPNTSYILPGDDYACDDFTQTKGGPRLLFNRIEIGWYGSTAETLTIAAIQVRVPGRGRLAGDYSCDVGGETLDAMFTDMRNGMLPSLPAIGSQSTATDHVFFNDRCQLKCFGINASDEFKNIAFSLYGDVKLLAYSVDADGFQTPVSVKKSVIVRYEP